MDDNQRQGNGGRFSLKDRVSRRVRTDEDDIGDWLHGDGAVVLGAITIFIILFTIFVAVF